MSSTNNNTSLSKDAAATSPTTAHDAPAAAAAAAEKTVVHTVELRQSAGQEEGLKPIDVVHEIPAASKEAPPADKQE
ncbi:uncharacterized protein LOC104584407 [Brachypodium distachyon]|uniref:Uncharacterized protein n=1 Tax=Brachypodium distachyon TaxID=15368 RepID=I1IIQ7_BRADI|nr:uncharacterized protein LOC104584407 [Brachypodium distachyon]KQJ86884.1 hypothetical protein BRADI_4g08240v3 [Brachypodium distachyon]|eukprot:XP_010237307.1 uncharacterized protein LOC104584407 [Brachypodium distachyon]